MFGNSTPPVRNRRKRGNETAPSHGEAARLRVVGGIGEDDPSAGLAELFGTPRFRTLLDHFPTAVYATDAEGRLTYFNRAAAALAGREPQLGVDRWSVCWRLLDADGAPLNPAEGPLATAIAERRPVRDVEAVAVRPDGGLVHFKAFPTPLLNERGKLIGVVDMLVDVTDRRVAEMRATYLARHDQLSGLPNRASFEQHLAAAVGEAAARGSEIAVALLDLDRLAEINESYGRGTGDEVLRSVADRLLAAAGGAFVARTGSDEFAVVFEPEGRCVAEVTRGILRAVVRPTEVGGNPLVIGASAGTAVYPRDGADAVVLVRAADAALRRAKAEGTGAVRLYEPAFDQPLQERALLQRDLCAAIATEALRLHYQPQLAADGTIVAFEALVRWPHPERGLVGPNRFIPLAEESGLIIPMSEWILGEACREAASWARPLRIAVNLSPVQMRSGDLVATVEAALAASGLAPERLELEITEGAMIDDFDRAVAILGRLRGLGVGIALDDFGTGYSSLSYLRAMPLTKLKIDRTFIADLGERSRAAPIIRAVVGLGHALGFEVAAEGVETAEQLDFLVREGCDIVQGYLTGRPGEISGYAAATGLYPRG